MAFVGENARDEFANVVFVVDDQDIGGHQDDLSSYHGGAFSGGRRRGRRRRRSADGNLISTCAPRPPSARGQAVEQLDVAVMILEDLDDDRQAEAGAFGARRHVGLDQACADPRSGIPCRCR